MTWPTKKLGEIRNKIKRRKAPEGTVPYIEIGNVDVESKNIIYTDKGAVKGSVFCPENSILISRVRPTRGAVVFVNKKYAVSSAFTIIKPKINPRLLFYFLAWNKKFFEYLGNLQKGTSYPSIRENDILSFGVSFPEDTNLQQKIVYVLDSIQGAVRAQSEIIEKTKELKKSLLNEIFNPKFKNQKWVQLGEVLDELYRYPTYYNIRYSESGVPEIRGELIKEDGTFENDLSQYRYISEETSKAFPRTILKKGDLVMSVRGTMGKIGLVSKKLEDANITANLIRLSPKRNKVFPNFLKYYLLSDFFRNDLERFSPQTTIKTIKAPVLASIKIPLPSIPRQQEIAGILQTVDKKIEIEQKKKALYEELFKTMLNKLMMREIEVDNLNLK